MNSLDDVETESNLRNCESICGQFGTIWDQGIGEYTRPCYDEYTPPTTDYSDYNSYWDNDDHWNHWDDDDHDNDEKRNDPWNLLFEDEVCKA